MTQWERGDKRAAAHLLGQAAEAAVQRGDDARAKALRRLAGDLQDALEIHASSLRASLVENADVPPSTMPSRQPGADHPRKRSHATSPQPAAKSSPTSGDGPRSWPGDRLLTSTMPAEADAEMEAEASRDAEQARLHVLGPLPCPPPAPFIPEIVPAATPSEETPTLPLGRPPRRSPSYRRDARARHGRLAGRSDTAKKRAERLERRRRSRASCATTATVGIDDKAIRVAARSAFARLSRSARATLRRTGRRLQLEPGAVLPEFGMAFVAQGTLCAHGTQVHACAVKVGSGSLVRMGGRKALHPIRWCACRGSVVVTVWDEATAAKMLSSTPVLEATLRDASDRVEALVSASQGALGRRACGAARDALFARSAVRRLRPGEVLVSTGDPLPGLMFTGAGLLLQVDGTRTRALAPGTAVLTTACLDGLPAPVTLRAGGTGASVLVTDRRAARELVNAWPLLIELLRQAG